MGGRIAVLRHRALHVVVRLAGRRGGPLGVIGPGRWRTYRTVLVLLARTAPVSLNTTGRMHADATYAGHGLKI
jgi:hypothetical protein